MTNNRSPVNRTTRTDRIPKFAKVIYSGALTCESPASGRDDYNGEVCRER